MANANTGWDGQPLCILVCSDGRIDQLISNGVGEVFTVIASPDDMQVNPTRTEQNQTTPATEVKEELLDFDDQAEINQ